MASNEVLSEGELDALMDSVSSGDVPLEDGGADGVCRPFDFSTREQALLAQMPALKTFNEKHAMGLAQGIRELFKIPVEVEPRATRSVQLSEVLVSIPEPSAINLVRTPPLNGISFIINPGDLLSFFVDHYFGGSAGGNQARPASRDLTPTERRINEVLATRFLLTLQAAWAEKISLTADLVSTETNPDFLQVGSPRQLALDFAFDIKVRDWSSSVHWVVPYTALEALRPKLGNATASQANQQGSADWESYLRQELPGVELEVSGVFSCNRTTIAEIMGLREGAVVPLQMPSEVTLCVEGEPFGMGEHGAFNGRKSIKITGLFGQPSGTQH
jgi:flagellar motor switch protein FliM